MPGAKPINARLEPTRVVPVTFRNWRRLIDGMPFSWDGGEAQASGLSLGTARL
jgi:hypothetical protein